MDEGKKALLHSLLDSFFLNTIKNFQYFVKKSIFLPLIPPQIDACQDGATDTVPSA